jgi:hypothetical protein
MERFNGLKRANDNAALQGWFIMEEKIFMPLVKKC